MPSSSRAVPTQSPPRSRRLIAALPEREENPTGTSVGVEATQPYANPYYSGIALGLVLLASFVVTGRGLGASGAFAMMAAGLVGAVSPSTTAANAFFSRYLADGASPWRDWLVFELGGVMVGAWLSARLSGRLRVMVERGPRLASPLRLVMATGGGGAMGIGAIFARGCTSGQGLTGGSVLSVGSWLFMLGAFAAAYAAAPLLRRAWQ
jgi:hypothetical protein